MSTPQNHPSKTKAKEILNDGTIRGQKLTRKQQKFFGWLASKEDGGQINFDSQQAAEILRQGFINGVELTDEQRSYLAQLAGTDEYGNSPEENTEEGEEQEEASPEFKRGGQPKYPDGGMTPEEWEAHNKSMGYVPSPYSGVHPGTYREFYNPKQLKYDANTKQWAGATPDIDVKFGQPASSYFYKYNAPAKPAQASNQQMYVAPTSTRTAVGFGAAGPGSITYKDSMTGQMYTVDKAGKPVISTMKTGGFTFEPSTKAKVAKWAKENNLPIPEAMQRVVDHMNKYVSEELDEVGKGEYNKGGQPCYNCGGMYKEGGPWNEGDNPAAKMAYENLLNNVVHYPPYPYRDGGVHYDPNTSVFGVSQMPAMAMGGEGKGLFEKMMLQNGIQYPYETLPTKALGGEGAKSKNLFIRMMVQNTVKAPKMAKGGEADFSDTNSYIASRKQDFLGHIANNVLTGMAEEEFANPGNYIDAFKMAFGGIPKYQAAGQTPPDNNPNNFSQNMNSLAFTPNDLYLNPDEENNVQVPLTPQEEARQSFHHSYDIIEPKDLGPYVNVPTPKKKSNYPYNANYFASKYGVPTAEGIIGTMNAISSVADWAGNRARDKYFKDKTRAENVFQVQTNKDRGDYDINSGMFRPDQNVPVQNTGYIGQYKSGGEYWMSDKDIEAIKAMGGQIEFLD